MVCWCVFASCFLFVDVCMRVVCEFGVCVL